MGLDVGSLYYFGVELVFVGCCWCGLVLGFRVLDLLFGFRDMTFRCVEWVWVFGCNGWIEGCFIGLMLGFAVLRIVGCSFTLSLLFLVALWFVGVR